MKVMKLPSNTCSKLMVAAAALSIGSILRADSPPPAPPPPSYADLVDLADSAPLVIRVQPRKLTRLEPERARGVRAGWGRFYAEAKTEALVAGTGSLGPALRYLVDLPLDPKGKPPKFKKKKSVVLFARAVPGRPDELQLVAPDAQLLWDPALDARLRGVLGELLAANAPQAIAGVREAIFVPGTLAGEGETQLFLTTAGGEPAALTVARRPGQPPRWGVSFSELVAAEGAAPPRDTLAWYRLACFLPRELPGSATVLGSSAERAAAARDYRFVIEQLGSCPRTRLR
jgi:hypothetical protein